MKQVENMLAGCKQLDCYYVNREGIMLVMLRCVRREHSKIVVVEALAWLERMEVHIEEMFVMIAEKRRCYANLEFGLDLEQKQMK